MPKARFNRHAARALIERSDFPSRAAFAKYIEVSPGTLTDVLGPEDDATVKPRREPSIELVKKMTRGLAVPVPTLLDAHDEVSA